MLRNFRARDEGLGAAAAIYTAFLFRQCEGRDLWQERGLLPHLLVQAILCGAAAILPFAQPAGDLVLWLGIAITLHGIFMTHGLKAKHVSLNARQATGYLPIVRMGKIGSPYRLGIVLGTALPVALLAFSMLHRVAGIAPGLHAAAAVSILAGLFFYKYAYVRAAQLPPLS